MSTGFITILENSSTSEKAPKFRGFIKIDGVESEFAAWPAKSGKPGVYTGTIKNKEEKPNEPW